MKRLADFVEDVVRDIDDVINRAQSDGLELFAEPCRARCNLDSGDGKEGVEGASVASGGDRGGVFFKFGGVIFLNRRHLGFEQGREFTGETGVGEEVWTVGGDLDFDEGVGFEEGFYQGARGGVGFENEEAIDFVLQANLRSSGEHALRCDAAHFGFSDDESAEVGARETAGDFVADLVVRRATDDLTKGAFTSVNLGDLEAVGVRVLNCFLDLGHHNLVALDTDFLEAFDFDASKGEEVADFFERAGAKIEAFFEPSERNIHKAGRRKAREAFFNRKSKKSRPGAFWSMKY